MQNTVYTVKVDIDIPSTKNIIDGHIF